LAMIIDFHTHVLSPRIKANRHLYAARDPVFALIHADERSRIATAEELIGIMDRDGVDISVIANYGWSTHELCVETNDYIMDAVARYPNRLVGFGAVPPGAAQAVAEIERCVRGGIKGVGELRPDIQPLDFARKEAMQPLVEVLREHRLILLTHVSEPVGHVYPGKGSFTPDRLYPFLTSFPDLPVVCAHWGGGLPFYTLMPEVREALENVYYDTAASPFLYRPEIYRYVSQLVGADRILFGSDCPLLSPGRLLREIAAADLSEEDRGLILSGNARRLLGLRG
jgi:predicted TIM-barrel fold metal-dependent hydrolase